MIQTKHDSNGLQYTGSPELLRALPGGLIRKFETYFKRPYSTIYSIISGKRWTNDNKVLECAVRVVALHASLKYEKLLADILKDYEPIETT